MKGIRDDGLLLALDERVFASDEPSTSFDSLYNVYHLDMILTWSRFCRLTA